MSTTTVGVKLDDGRLYEFLLEKDPRAAGGAARAIRIHDETVVVIRVWHSREVRR